MVMVLCRLVVMSSLVGLGRSWLAMAMATTTDNDDGLSINLWGGGAAWE